MNLGALRQACIDRTGYGDPAFNPQWNTFINEAIRDFARRQPWDGLEDLITVTTDGTQYVVLPPFVDTVIYVLNKSFHIPVDRSSDWDREASAIYSQRTTGRVINYDKIGEVATIRDPSGYVWFQSSHASDVYGSIYITGRVAASGASGTALQSVLQTLQVTPTGTSPVTLSTQFAQITSIAKTTDTNGDFYFYDAGASNLHVSYLGRYEDDAVFRRIQLLYKPGDQQLLEIKFRHKIPSLKNDSQSPNPAVKPDYVVHFAIARFFEQQSQLSKAAQKDAMAQAILERETNKDLNFNEPYSHFVPMKYDDDPDSTGDGYWRLV